MKRIILPALSLAAILAVSSTMAFAEYNPNKITNQLEVSTKQALQPNSIVVNGTTLKDAATYKSDNKLMIPIRAIAEELGFEVKWENGTTILINGAQYITFKLGEDGYTFAKTAPMSLGKAPELKDSITYVPVDIINEIMNFNVTISENNSISIKSEESNNINTIEYNTKIISKDLKQNNQILVYNEKRGKLKLNLKDTEIVKENGESASFKDLIENNFIYVEYDDTISEFNLSDLKSDPKDRDSFTTPTAVPLISAKKIIIPISNPTTILYTAEIIELGNNYILVNDSEKSSEIKLNISEDTKISKSNNEAATINDLKVGDNLHVVYGEAMTFSLPPMNNPERIIVKVDSNEQVKGNIEFLEDIKDNQVMVNDSVLGDVLLNISNDTEIVDEAGNNMDKSTIKKDMSAIITYGEAMTASLPPMNNPIKIVITENLASNNNTSSSGNSQVKEESLSFTGKITGTEENGMLLFEDEENKNIYALNIDENTIIIDSNNKTIPKEDLKDDIDVNIKVSPRMTRSIPPQTYAFEIKLLGGKPIQKMQIK